jgi:hypothetical protein
MTQRNRVAADICGEDPNKGEAQSTFDRLLREYFATFAVGEPATASGESRSPESDADHRSRHSERTAALEALS